ncbi:MAG TPA: N-acetyltransferase [Blastocatellia bacterium]|nr:N-acetyltransferase [Blastocatellia bacterium]
MVATRPTRSSTRRAGQNLEGVTVAPVRTWWQRRHFVNLPYRLNRRSNHWVAPLRIAQKDLLNTARHPFYKTSDVEMFLAYRGKRVVGRIMAILNRAHNEFHQERAGFFGFFDVENDPDAATALLDAARQWLQARDVQVMRGPVSPSTNYECGLLVDGFDRDPAVMMPYNPPYYADLIEACGLTKAKDLYAFWLTEDQFVVSDKLTRVAERAKKKDGLTVRTVDLKRFEAEVQAVRKVYNDAWSLNWGFVPVHDEEFQHLARDMKQIVDPEVVYIAERQVEGMTEPQPVGFMLAVPDLNRALKRLSGRLLPVGIFKLLWYSRKINSIRVITLGVAKEYQSLGIAAVFYDEVYRRGRAKGYSSAEASWVLEDNVLMIRAIEMLGARRHKTYRIYEIPLSD